MADRFSLVGITGSSMPCRGRTVCVFMLVCWNGVPSFLKVDFGHGRLVGLVLL